MELLIIKIERPFAEPTKSEENFLEKWSEIVAKEFDNNDAENSSKYF